MAKLYFNYSTMNAGKSTVLLQASHNYRERGMDTYLMTAAVDGRAGNGRIASRIGISEQADVFRPQDDVCAMIAARQDKGPIACVFIDEAQFLSEEQVWQLARAVDDLNVPVLAYGLRVDFQGKLFPGVGGPAGPCRRNARSAHDLQMRTQGDHGDSAGRKWTGNHRRRAGPDRRQ